MSLAFRLFALTLALAWSAPSATPSRAAEIRVAVAANFAQAAGEVADAFTAETGHAIVLSFGSTGQLYAQITQAAPFDLFLAADQARPKQLVADGLAIAESRFTYAVGRLVLWSAEPGVVTGEETLRGGAFESLAIADPAAAPYGAAAIETLDALGLTAALRPRLVTGANIAQTFQFVETGNAELGFVALAQLARTHTGSRWIVPESLYGPIRQDAVLLTAARESKPARAFLDFLAGEAGRAIIESHGYGTGR